MLRPFGSFALVSTSKPLRQPSWIPPFLRRSLVSSLQISYGRSYPWAIGKGPIISIVDSPFRPMLNILARMIFQLIPVACPNHVASGDVYTLLKILQEAHGCLGKASNTKYATQQIAEQIQSWLPARATDPIWPGFPTWDHPASQPIGWASSTLQKAPRLPDRDNPTQLLTQLPFNPHSWATPTPQLHQPSNQPASLLSHRHPTNGWLTLVDNMPSSLAVRSFNKWLKELPLSEAQRAVLTTNIAKTEAWWGKQPAEALETVQRWQSWWAFLLACWIETLTQPTSSGLWRLPSAWPIG